MDASQTELHYEGRGYIHEIDENGKIDKDTRPPLEVIYIVKHLKYGANSFATEIRPIDGDVERTSSLVDYSNRKIHCLSIESIEPIDYPFRIEQIHRCSAVMNTITVHHGRYDLGHTSNFKLIDNKLRGVLKLSRCRALRPRTSNCTLHYDGTISHDRYFDHEPRKITHSLGELTLALHYDWENDQLITGSKSVTRIESPQIIIDIADIKCEPSLFFNSVEEQLDSLLTLLSFFSREHVVITSIELTAVIERGYTYPSPRRAISQRHSGASSESMFTADAFRGSDFAQLLEHFEQSTPHDVLARAMRLIVSSYQINNLESAYFLAHSAVEAICKELTRDFQGKKIEDLLNDDFEAVKDIFSRMSEKLDSKKKGRVVMDFLRVIITLDRLDIDLSCMNGWRKDGWEHGWERGIKHAFINRNDLFHQGLVKNPDLLTQDLYRLRFIFELIALKLLDIDLNSSGYHPIGGW